jgi:tRNA threonylcarbamoyladenosine biosynthesis protein TsaE
MSILNSESIEYFSRSPEQSKRFVMRLGCLLQKGDLICFSGDLGAGKTTFVQGIAKGWGSIDPVTSPTFVLINEYNRMDKNILFHFDAYRIGNTWEAEDLDVDRMLRFGSLVIEWAERIDEILPKEKLWIKMEWVSDEQRRITFTPQGKRYVQITQSFRQKTFGV